MKFIYICILLALSLAPWACSFQVESGESKSVAVAVVRKGRITLGISEVGVLKARNSSTVASPSHSTIVNMVQEGTFVKKGDPVVWLETRDDLEEKRRAEIEFKKSQVELDQEMETLDANQKKKLLELADAHDKKDFSMAKYDLAATELQRRERLVDSGVLPEQSLRRARIDFEEAGLDLQNKTIALERLEKEKVSDEKTKGIDVVTSQLRRDARRYWFEEYERRLEKAILYAPQDGIIVYKTNWRGKKIKIGDRLWWGRAILEIPDFSEMYVLSQVDESDRKDSIRMGMDVEIEINAVEGLHGTGEIEDISEIAISREEAEGARRAHNDQTMLLRVFETQISFPVKDDRMKPDMTAKVRYILKRFDDAFYVPRKAVVFIDSQAYIKPMNGDSDLLPVTVIGADEEIAVITGELEPGMPVSLEPQAESRGGLARGQKP